MVMVHDKTEFSQYTHPSRCLSVIGHSDASPACTTSSHIFMVAMLHQLGFATEHLEHRDVRFQILLVLEVVGPPIFQSILNGFLVVFPGRIVNHKEAFGRQPCIPLLDLGCRGERNRLPQSALIFHVYMAIVLGRREFAANFLQELGGLLNLLRRFQVRHGGTLCAETDPLKHFRFLASGRPKNQRRN